MAVQRGATRLGSSRRGKAGQVDSRDLSSGLGRTRPAIIENAPSHATEKRRRRSKRSGLLSGRQAEGDPAVPAVKHAIRQRFVEGTRRCKGKERKNERKETTTQRSRERARRSGERERESAEGGKRESERETETWDARLVRKGKQGRIKPVEQ